MQEHVATSLEGEPEIDTTAECMAIHGWAGSTIRVVADGPVVRSFDEPIPRIPPGVSTKAFLGMIVAQPIESGAAAVETRPKPWRQRFVSSVGQS